MNLTRNSYLQKIVGSPRCPSDTYKGINNLRLLSTAFKIHLTKKMKYYKKIITRYM